MGQEPTVVVVDCETTIKPKELQGVGTYGPQLVALGMATIHHEERYPAYVACHIDDPLGRLEHLLSHLEKADVIAGHNLKFDLHTLFRQDPDFGKSLHSTQYMFWDTMLVAYILSGQRFNYISLEELATHYGIPFAKDLEIAKAFEAGMGADTVDKERLMAYLKSDVEVTVEIVKRQMNEVTAHGMWPLVMAMMGAFKASVYMEEKGMQLDKEELKAFHNHLTGAIVGHTATYTEALKRHILYQGSGDIRTLTGHWPYLSNGGPTSIQLLAAIIYGEEYTFEFRVPEGVYKSGKKSGDVRVRIHKIPIKFDAQRAMADDGSTPVDEDTLANLVKATSGTPSSVHDLLKCALEMRHLTKARGYLESWHDYADHKYVVRTDYGLCTTPTGRWTSSNPNFQNIPNKEGFPKIKQCYIASTPDHSIVEIDFKQLEVIGAAMQTRDTTMRKHVLEGRDIHDETGQRVYAGKMSKDQRRLVKTVNFGLIYGGGVNRIADDSGLRRDLVSKIRTALYELYPGLKEFRKRVESDLLKEAAPADGGASPALHSYWTDPLTKRRYYFKQYPDKFRPTEYCFSFTEMSNYPIQGLATGDIVPTIIGLLDGYIQENAIPVVLCNAIHDSIIMEVDSTKFTEDHRQLLAHFFTTMNQRLDQVFGQPGAFDLPLKVTATLYPVAWGRDELDITDWLYYNRPDVSFSTLKQTAGIPF